MAGPIGLPFRLLAIAGLIGFQVTFVQAGHAQSTPAIPEAQPSPSPTSSRPEELPQHPGTRNEIQPLIPPGKLPSPSPTSPSGTGEVVGGITQQQAEEFDRKFESALSLTKITPPGLFSLSLLDAVRIALAQNKDLRLVSDSSRLSPLYLQAGAGGLPKEQRCQPGVANIRQKKPHLFFNEIRVTSRPVQGLFQSACSTSLFAPCSSETTSPELRGCL